MCRLGSAAELIRAVCPSIVRVDSRPTCNDPPRRVPARNFAWIVSQLVEFEALRVFERKRKVVAQISGSLPDFEAFQKRVLPQIVEELGTSAGFVSETVRTVYAQLEPSDLNPEQFDEAEFEEIFDRNCKEFQRQLECNAAALLSQFDQSTQHPKRSTEDKPLTISQSPVGLPLPPTTSQPAVKPSNPPNKPHHPPTKPAQPPVKQPQVVSHSSVSQHPPTRPRLNRVEEATKLSDQIARVAAEIKVETRRIAITRSAILSAEARSAVPLPTLHSSESRRLAQRVQHLSTRLAASSSLDSAAIEASARLDSARQALTKALQIDSSYERLASSTSHRLLLSFLSRWREAVRSPKPVAAPNRLISLVESISHRLSQRTAFDSLKQLFLHCKSLSLLSCLTDRITKKRILDKISTAGRARTLYSVMTSVQNSLLLRRIFAGFSIRWQRNCRFLRNRKQAAFSRFALQIQSSAAGLRASREKLVSLSRQSALKKSFFALEKHAKTSQKTSSAAQRLIPHMCSMLDREALRSSFLSLRSTAKSLGTIRRISEKISEDFRFRLVRSLARLLRSKASVLLIDRWGQKAKKRFFSKLVRLGKSSRFGYDFQTAKGRRGAIRLTRLVSETLHSAFSALRSADFRSVANEIGADARAVQAQYAQLEELSIVGRGKRQELEDRLELLHQKKRILQSNFEQRRLEEAQLSLRQIESLENIKAFRAALQRKKKSLELAKILDYEAKMLDEETRAAEGVRALYADTSVSDKKKSAEKEFAAFMKSARKIKEQSADFYQEGRALRAEIQANLGAILEIKEQLFGAF